ncbi:MAG: Uma2 family endonuclease [Chloroflexi bacterium]|nr:Uma2 family endonuclease [Chloroflexota bacterium]MCI0869829.1 Uma2 family endonuclease [Chloroflexota bacterium]MCI0887019.1 Uma2 family endonuclease [Chloroflexota bacterium]
MTTQTTLLTYDDYINGPEIKQRYDIVDGKMIFMAPAPTLRHQRILRLLVRILDTFVTEQDLGEIYFAPADVVIQRSPLRTRQPDLLFVSNERSEILGDVVEGGPDLVVEILSPSNSRQDIADKLADYANVGVRECWLVSPEAQTVEVLALTEGVWRRTSLHGQGDPIHSNIFDDLEAGVSQLFV